MPALETFMAQRRLLMVLDNFEQVLPAASEVGRLLAASPGLTVLVTSREPLRLRWERALPLSPLDLPDPRHLPALDQLASVPAVALFLERARAAAPAFELTRENASAVAELCVRLDGLPLAIELVAARAVQFGAAATLDRLSRHLPLPTSTMRDAPARQQSLRATLQWSLDLLDTTEQVLLRRLAVFAGGWTLAAAEAVAGEDVPDVLGALTSLTDKSLIVLTTPGGTDEPRFRILDTVREVALDLLEASGESAAVRSRHAGFLATLAEATTTQLQGLGQAAVSMRLEREEENFRQALRWALGRGDADALEEGLRLAGALGWYWFLHGYPPEARDWFQVLIGPAAAQDQTPAARATTARAATLRARALNAAGFQATNQGEYVAAYSLHEQALATWRELRDTPGMVASLHGMGDTALWQVDSDRARGHYVEGLELARATGTAEDVALFTFHLGQLCWLVDDLDAADTWAREALVTARSAGSTTWPPYALYVQASVAHERGDTPRAGALYRESLELAWEHHDRLGVRMVLPGLAGLAVAEGDAARAVRLAGAASALEENAGIWAFPPIKARHERWLAAAEQALDPQTRATAWAQGRGMSLDEALAHALEEPAAASAGHERGVGRQGALSPREREVLAMVAEGKSNREIAAALVVTEHTAKYHVASLLNKLGATSRAEVVTRAVALGLLTPRAELRS
jgi:non-specific serine/threonine protein kinase